jgi:hypothetical protein
MVFSLSTSNSIVGALCKCTVAEVHCDRTCRLFCPECGKHSMLQRMAITVPLFEQVRTSTGKLSLSVLYLCDSAYIQHLPFSGQPRRKGEYCG